MSRFNLSVVKIMQGIILLLLFLALVYIGFNIIRQTQTKTEVAVAGEDIPEQKMEKLRSVESQEGKNTLEIRADTHYVGEDGLNHLEGKVRLVFPKKSEGEDITITGEKITYDEELKYFSLENKGTVKFKDIRIQAQALEYDAERELFKTNKEVFFTSGRLEGSAQSLSYSMQIQRLELRKDLKLKIKPKLGSDTPVFLNADKLIYFKNTGKGECVGKVEMIQGKSHVRAGRMNFELTSDREFVKSVDLKEDVDIIFYLNDEKMSPVSEGEEKAKIKKFSREGWEIKAQTVFLEGYRINSRFKRILAKGECFFKFIQSSEDYSQIKAGMIDLTLERDGELKEFMAENNSSLVERDKKTGEERQIDGHKILIDGKKNELIVSGKENGMAKMLSSGYEITADTIKLFLENNDLEAGKNVKVIISSRKEDEKTVGFFSKDQAMFIASPDLRYTDEDQRFYFFGGIKIWQQKQMLLAEDFNLYRDTGKFLGSGGIKTVFPYESKKDEEEKKIEIESEELSYRPEKNAVAYSGKCILKVKDIQMQAQVLSVLMDDENGTVSGISAEKEVKVLQNKSEGRGEKAFFNVEEEIFILEGHPELIDENKGRIQGDKLTFHMADGKITVENKGEKRSISVIKK
ncbi:MAG: LPS export ABC transporter periplasmic protein LptC [Candidatus Aminicenantes bacterium]|nr:LPS export ABC transporter periplasmic protein LptC [Candidatus Aminicenantes bacterium]